MNLNEFITVLSLEREIFRFAKLLSEEKVKNKKSDWCKKLFKKLTIYKILDILVKDGI